MSNPTTVGTLHPDCGIDVGDTVVYGGGDVTVVSFTPTGLVNYRTDDGVKSVGWATFFNGVTDKTLI